MQHALITVFYLLFYFIIDPLIRDFSSYPNSFFGLETSCSDSDPYDNFTLTCTATKPTIVIPNLVIAWTHNGTIETGTVTTAGGNMTTTVTNTLSFDSVTASDSGTYRCTASINSTIIMTSNETTVTIKRKWILLLQPFSPLSSHYDPTLFIAQSLPSTAINVTATPGTTTAAISFIIPNIAYTPETYSVKYTGAILQTTQATSIIRRGSNNITAINQEFTIMLTGLEEDNTYTYTVDSINCLGTTSTVEMHFRTHPTCKRMCLYSFVSFLLFSPSSVFTFLIVLFIILLSLYFYDSLLLIFLFCSASGASNGMC